MKRTIVTTGYSGLYRGPFKYLDPQNNVLHWSISGNGREIFLMPLSTNFFNTANSIIEHVSFQVIYICCPTIDYFNAYDLYQLFQRAKALHKEISIITTAYNVDLGEEFESIVDITTDRNIVIQDGDDIYRDVSVSFSFFKDKAGEMHLYYNNGEERIIFPSKITDELCKILENEYACDFEELHMPYINHYYGGYGFNDLNEKYPKLAKKCIINMFGSELEEETCNRYKIKKGRLIF